MNWLIPLLSGAGNGLLGGRYLHEKLGRKKRLFWLLLAGLHELCWLVSFFGREPGAKSFFCGFLASDLILLSVMDLETRQIPAELLGYLLILAVWARLFLPGSIWYYGAGVLPAVFLWLFYLLWPKAYLGGGDIKLLGICGIFLGPEKITAALFGASALALLCWGAAGKEGERSRELAFGPYLSIAVFIAALC